MSGTLWINGRTRVKFRGPHNNSSFSPLLICRGWQRKFLEILFHFIIFLTMKTNTIIKSLLYTEFTVFVYCLKLSPNLWFILKYSWFCWLLLIHTSLITYIISWSLEVCYRRVPLYCFLTLSPDHKIHRWQNSVSLYIYCLKPCCGGHPRLPKRLWVISMIRGTMLKKNITK
jgi:energy-coupling factor transporter transmembrane protein EcfT